MHFFPFQSESSERDEILKNLFSTLVLVSPSSIPKWNVDKSVKEEKGGEPFLLRIDSGSSEG